MEALQLKHFPGTQIFAKQSSEVSGWYLQDGSEHRIPPVTADFFEKSGSLNSNPNGGPGPVLVLGVQLRAG